MQIAERKKTEIQITEMHIQITRIQKCKGGRVT